MALAILHNLKISNRLTDYCDLYWSLSHISSILLAIYVLKAESDTSLLGREGDGYSILFSASNTHIFIFKQFFKRLTTALNSAAIYK